jgi:hypothetical protein
MDRPENQPFTQVRETLLSHFEVAAKMAATSEDNWELFHPGLKEAFFGTDIKGDEIQDEILLDVIDTERQSIQQASPLNA